MVLRLAERLAYRCASEHDAGRGGLRAAICRAAARRPAMGAARAAVDLILSGHEPYPAVLVDRHWNLLARTSRRRIDAGIDPSLLGPPANALRATLHPKGMARASRTWRSGAHICSRVWHTS